jgi:hypothetical protein
MAYPSKRSLNKKSCGALVDLGVWTGCILETVSKALAAPLGEWKASPRRKVLGGLYLSSCIDEIDQRPALQTLVA